MSSSAVFMNSTNSQLTLEVKSKYDAEFRRFGLQRQTRPFKFEDFYTKLEKLHGLNGIQFNICYTDKDGDLLPINNDNNLARVLNVTVGILRLFIQRKGECYNNQQNGTYQHNQTSDHFYSSQTSYQNGSNNSFSNHNLNNGNGQYDKNSNLNSSTSYRAASNLISQIKSLKELSNTLTSNHHHQQQHNNNNNKPFVISYPEDFRPVSAIIDVDLLPDTLRRVRLHKHKSSKPLGFYIRDGRSLRVTPQGVEQVPGIFISRLMPGGLAESTGLLSVNDEVIEVNGIEVSGKTLDQVTDMMVANSSNLIITVKPTNQRYNLNRHTATANSPNVNANNLNSQTNTLTNATAAGGGIKPTPYQSQMSQQQNNRSFSFGKSKPSSAEIQKLKEESTSVSASSASANSSFSNNYNGKSTTIAAQTTTTSTHDHQVKTSQITLDLINCKVTTSNLDPDLDEDDDDNDDDDDDDDEEEIHDANSQSPSNSPDNSDDKILTL
jgi:hypothetical protein